MRTRCPSCGGVIEGREATLESCPACGALVDAARNDPNVTVPPAGGFPDDDPTTSPVLEQVTLDTPTLAQARPGAVMPPRLNVSLAIVGGPRSGQVVRLERSSCVIGREGTGAEADLAIDDPALSRAHAVLEVLGNLVVLRDLGSRNGTFVDDKRVETAILEDRAEFRLGGTSFMLILTSKE